MPARFLTQLVPDVDVLMAMEPEELAGPLLQLASDIQKERNGHFHVQDINVDAIYAGRGSVPGVPQYSRGSQQEIERRIVEGVQWLRNSLLIVPVDASTNGANGWMRLSRRGEAVNRDGFKAFKDAAAFPKELLHPLIADKVYLSLARGDLEEAVFNAFKRVEIEVRAAGKFSASLVGVKLMRKAFDPNGGPLTDMEQDEAERESLSALFAGAMGSYKNPVSHRTVTIAEPREAQEIVLLASHLLRIVDARRKA